MFQPLYSMWKDGMSREGRKMSPTHVTLKAGVNNKFYKCIFTTVNVCYVKPTEGFQLSVVKPKPE